MNYELSKEEIRDMLCENKVWDAIEVLKDGFIEEYEKDNEARRRLGQEEEELDEDDIRDFIESRLPEELETLFDRYIGDNVDCDLLINILGDISKDGDFDGASTDYINELL
jgi:hypothetical protein|tara:strand:- start:3334 stop:3666 length:333 start_codon:yes stop_codon:yes gene_type:complete